MCGICGFAGSGDRDVLRKMAGRLAHRGPDAEGAWHDGKHNIFLGHRRLSIIDLAGGSQPMTTADGKLTVTFNGEIYNHEALRKELAAAGHWFATAGSDTEVLLHGYRQWGKNLPEKLNGMWAFALYDRERKTLFLSRDRFGKKPLFYYSANGLFAFASELTALCAHPSIKPSVDRLGLKKLFAYNFIPAPHSLYSSIKKLPAGHNAVFNVVDGKLSIEKYWEFVLEPFATVPADPEAEWGEAIRKLLQKAVERRLMSDVPLGIFLSGGMDSSSIAYYAGKRNGYGGVKTFSIGFEEKSFDESAYSSAMAKLLGTAHRHATLSIENAVGLMPEIARRLDEPLGDGSLIAAYLLCKETRKHVTVALGGDGADELFAGYDPFRALRLAEIYKKIVPRPVHDAIALAAARLPTSHANISFDFKLKRTMRGLSYPSQLWNPVWLGALDPASLNDLFGEPTSIEEIYSEAIDVWDSCAQEDLVDKTLQFYTRLYLADDILVKVDRASMLNSLEVRAPYLDIDLVDFVRKIPWQYKLRNGTTKYILKKALSPVLPRDIIHRPKKGFGVPVGKWFKENSLTVTANHPGLAMFDNDYIKAAIEDHKKGRIDQRALLWNLYLLENRFDF